MRQILKTLSLLAIGWLAIGCGDKGYDISETPSFTVEYSDSQYPASGGSGTIEVKLLHTATPMVHSDKDWCHVTQSGETIRITVDSNSEMSSRESAVNITVGNYSRTVPIFQNGIIFYPLTDVGLLGDQVGDELVIPLFRDGNFELTIKEYPDWVMARLEEDKLLITATEIAPTHTREGEVVLQVGEIVKTVKFTQKEFTLGYDQFIGSWKMSAYSTMPTEENPVDPNVYNVTISAKEEGKTLILSGLLYDIVLTYEDGEISFYAAQSVGTYTTGDANFNVIVRLVNSGTGSSSTSSRKIVSTYEIFDGQLELTLSPDSGSIESGYIGFGFYYTNASGSNTALIRYRHEIKLYQ